MVDIARRPRGSSADEGFDFDVFEVGESTVVDIGSAKQLFLDDHIVGRLQNVWRVLNKAERQANVPVVSADQSWEGPDVQAVQVIYDEDRRQFRMWYSTFRSGGEIRENGEAGLSYAVSDDGIAWEKPDLGIVGIHGSKANSALFVNTSRLFNSFGSIVYCPEETDLSRRYKTLSFKGANAPKPERPGWFPWYSADGIRWRADDEQNAAVKYDHVSICEVSTQLYDPDHRRYIAFTKYSYYGCPPVRAYSYGLMRRCQGVMTSEDFVHWSPNHHVLAPDELDDFLARRTIMERHEVLRFSDPREYRAEFYQVNGMSEGGLVIGLMSVFDSSGGVQDGPVHVQLVCSRDLRVWNRVGERMPLLAPSEAGRWDGGCVYPVNPFVRDGKIWVYYTGANRGHAVVEDFRYAIGLATLRADGFVSINARRDGGTLMTKPVKFTGKRLVLNVDASAGEVAVELLNRNGRSIEGFTGGECDPIREDRLCGTVSWSGRSDLSGVAGKPVFIRFHLCGAKLYSFRFVD